MTNGMTNENDESQPQPQYDQVHTRAGRMQSSVRAQYTQAQIEQYRALGVWRECIRCGRGWAKRGKDEPKKCPNWQCQSTAWNRPLKAAGRKRTENPQRKSIIRRKTAVPATPELIALMEKGRIKPLRNRGKVVGSDLIPEAKLPKSMRPSVRNPVKRRPFHQLAHLHIKHAQRPGQGWRRTLTEEERG